MLTVAQNVDVSQRSCTAIAKSKNYWSPVHCDDDFLYTTLSCLSPDENDKDVLFHFAFPTYKVYFPMRSGDVMVFNPMILHCCTNPTKEGVHIFSFYVPAKTCNTQIAAQLLNLKKEKCNEGQNKNM